ncbi:MAG: hypothetical protein P8184_20660, partial [Calditrichia bacterium]
MKFVNKKFPMSLLILVMALLIFRNSLPAQESGPASRLALSDIQIQTTASLRVKIANPIKKYRYSRADEANIKKIENDILAQLHQNGYYLSKIDSFRVTEMGRQQAVLYLYVSPGLQFKLGTAEFIMPDSLTSRFSGQLAEIAKNYRLRPYNEGLQKQMFHDVIALFENSGYPLCRITTEGFTLDSLAANEQAVNLRLRVDPGQLVKLQGLRLPAKSGINPRYLERTFGFRSGDIYREKEIGRYRKLLSRQDFIRSAGRPRIVMGEDSLYYLSMNYEENTSTSLDGVVGYIPAPANDPAQSGYFTGLLNIGLLNFFGTGRRLDVNWQKPDRFSEEFRVKYREPFVLG